MRQTLESALVPMYEPLRGLLLFHLVLEVRVLDELGVDSLVLDDVLGCLDNHEPVIVEALAAALPAIWWNWRAERSLVFSPSNLERPLNKTHLIGMFTPTPQAVCSTD